MTSFKSFYQALIDEPKLSAWLEDMPKLLMQWEKESQHGDRVKWQKAIEKLPENTTTTPELKHSVSLGNSDSATQSEQAKIENLLRMLHPWRKGPYSIHDVHVDTEWRSDWKWDRLLPYISSLHNRCILDVGCGNGYHMWRMLGEGAARVVGVDPSTLFLCQFQAMKKLLNPQAPVDLLPLGIEQLPEKSMFDTVFSMGVLYHRRAPMDHLLQLKHQLRTGGELVLETLVVEGDEQTVLVPNDRYGKMNNVWFLPSAAALKLWLKKCGFTDIKVVDQSATSTDEQRSTTWMTNESLEDYLHPEDPSKTIEGHPAPLRAVFIAKKGD